MTDTILKNPVTDDVVTLLATLSNSEADPLVFTTWLPAGAAGSRRTGMRA